MKKTILITAMAAFLLGITTPAYAQDVQKAPIETELSAVSITISGSVIRIKNAEKMTLEIYDIAGVKVSTYRIDSAEKTIELNLPKGCYILKVGKTARKYYIK